jgi:type I restriction enzyme, S subunit
MWKTVKLDEIVAISMGKTPSRSNAKFWDKEKVSNNIWLSIADLTALEGLYVGDSKEYVSDEGAKLFKIVPSETLVMSFKLSIGKLAVTKCELRTNEAIAALPIKNKELVTKEYLYYFLSSIDWDALSGNDVKVKGKTLNKAKLKEIPILLPPLAEQQRIVAKLDAAFAEIDRAIEVAEAKEAKVEKLKASLLSDLFSGDAVVRETVKLGDIVTYEKMNGQGSNLPYVGMEHISSETMELVGSLEIPEKTSSTFKFDERHVLFGRLRPYLRKVFVPDFDGQCSTEIFCLLPSDKVDQRFLAHWLLHPKVSTRINETSTGARMPRANMNAILDFEFPLPPLAEQQRIVAKLDAAFAEIDTAKLAIQRAKENHVALKAAILAQELTPPAESEAA